MAGKSEAAEALARIAGLGFGAAVNYLSGGEDTRSSFGNTTTMTVTGNKHRGGYIGQTLNETFCSQKYERKDRTTTRRLAEEIMNQKAYRIQSLNASNIAPYGSGTYRGQGSQQLTSLFYEGAENPVVYPQLVALPMYVYRLGLPDGFQSNYPFPNDQRNVNPIVSYRLWASKASAGAVWIYSWRPQAQSLNMLSNRPDTGFLPTAFTTKTDTNQVFSANKFRHDSSVIDLLAFGARNRTTFISCGVVRFNDDAFCPPDEYYINAADGYPSAVKATLRTNSGSYCNPLTPLIPDGVDLLETTQAYNQFWQAVEGHPLRKSTTYPAPRTVFSWEKRWMKTLGPSTTVDNDPTGIKHHHRLIYKPQRWYHTSIKDGLDNSGTALPGPDNVSRIVQSNMQEDVGVFPLPMVQRWFMVYASTQNGAWPKDTPFNPDSMASFDIAVEHNITYIRNWAYPVPQIAARMEADVVDEEVLPLEETK